MAARQASIFIGYRRRDSQGFAGRVADDLIERFGAAQVFRDDDIPEGADFTAALDAALSACRVLIVVIGPRWVHASDADGRPRLHDPDDWVRREIEQALRHGVWVLPVLVGKAAMPRVEELPATLSPLTRIQAFEMSDRGWDEHLERLVALLKRRIPALASARSDRSPPNPVPALRGALESHWREALRRRGATGSVRTSGFARRLGAVMTRLFWLAVLSLVGWFLLENYATPELRRGVYEFIAFAREKLTLLIERIGKSLGFP